MSLSYDSTKPVFVSPSGRFGVAEASSVFEAAFAGPRPVLIYVHGRAKDIGEPRKSMEAGIYDELEGYGVTVLGFTWDADDKGFDETRALASVPDLRSFFESLRSFFQRPENSGLQKPSLLAHSMGNILLAELAKDDMLLSSELGGLFQNIVLNAAAVKSKRHDAWLKRIQPIGSVFVMLNEHDIVLRFAGALFKPDMLGKEPRRPGAASATVNYLDLGALGLNHRYFVPSAQRVQVHLKSFFETALSGQGPSLANCTDAAEINGIPVRRFRPQVGLAVQPALVDEE